MSTQPQTLAQTSSALIVGTPAAVFSMKNSAARAPYEAIGEEQTSAGKWQFWGENDTLPVDLATDCQDSTVIAPGMEFQAAMLYGAGIAHGTINVESGTEKFTAVRDPEFVDFMRRNNLDRQVYCAGYDFGLYGLAVAQLVLNKKRDRIVEFSVEKNRARFCRLSKKTAQGQPVRVFINADFGTSEFNENKTRSLELAPAYDPVSWVKRRIKESESFYRFAVLVRVVDPGRMYYPRPAWNSLRRSGWLEIAQNLASYKKHLLQNQLSVKYHVEIHPDFWTEIYGAETWNKFTPAERTEKMKEWVQEFSDKMHGHKNSGNTLLTSMKAGHEGLPDRVFSLVKINTIDDRFLKEGVHIEDSREAVLHAMAALNIHPELFGSTPSNQMGSGSGSGARVAFNQRVAMAKARQDQVLAPLGIVRDFNGWDRDLVFRMRNSLITTLDTGASATAPTPQT